MDEKRLRDNVRTVLASLAAMEDSKSAFARKCGTTPSNVGHWLAGDTIPSLEKLLEIANIYGVPLSTMVGGMVAEQASLTPDEEELLAAYRELDAAGRLTLREVARRIRA